MFFYSACHDPHGENGGQMRRYVDGVVAEVQCGELTLSDGAQRMQCVELEFCAPRRAATDYYWAQCKKLATMAADGVLVGKQVSNRRQAALRFQDTLLARMLYGDPS